MTRYSRQTLIPEIGLEGQERLDRARVLCVGVGGLGSPAALYLAAAGVGRLGLIDPDQVSVSNLQRQILFESSDEGSFKALTGAKRLTRLNPGITIQAYAQRLSSENVEELFENYDLILDGTDNFETRFLVNDAAFKLGIPVVYGAVNHLEGQVALFWAERGACYRCLQPAHPQAPIRNCAEAGVLGSVVGAIGSLQATLALQFLISGGDERHPLVPRFGELGLLDLGGRWNLRTLQVEKRPDCPTCSKSPEEIELRKQTSLSASLVLDVRTSEEWASGHIVGAVHWPLHKLERGDFPAELESAAEVVVYCRAGARSMQAARILTERGVQDVRSLEGGIEAWAGGLV